MEMCFTATKVVPVRPDMTGKAQQVIHVKFFGNAKTVEELLELLKNQGYEIS